MDNQVRENTRLALYSVLSSRVSLGLLQLQISLPFSIMIIDLQVIQEAVSVFVPPRILIVLISLEIIVTPSMRPAAIISCSNVKYKQTLVDHQSARIGFTGIKIRLINWLLLLR